MDEYNTRIGKGWLYMVGGNLTEKYARANTISLKSHTEYNERWLQRIIAEDTTILGLGELELLAAERRQPHSGRLDLMLMDAETSRRYEVELQLGPTDESAAA
jgi:hypothetical protein